MLQRRLQWSRQSSNFPFIQYFYTGDCCTLFIVSEGLNSINANVFFSFFFLLWESTIRATVAKGTFIYNYTCSAESAATQRRIKRSELLCGFRRFSADVMVFSPRTIPLFVQNKIVCFDGWSAEIKWVFLITCFFSLFLDVLLIHMNLCDHQWGLIR